jgi:hypothetical protein
VSPGFSLNSLRRAQWRLRLVVLCLLAFTVQSALASAHLHISAYGRTTQSVASTLFTSDVGAPSGSTDLAKRAGDNANCPLCQFLILGSAALHPTHVAALAPVESAAFVVADQTFARFVSAVSYSWQGRGPPQL